jgi:hypothetical protein
MNLFGGATDTGASYLAIGNVFFSASGAAAGLDDIDVTVVPEPQAMVLLAISGLLFVVIRKRPGLACAA